MFFLGRKQRECITPVTLSLPELRIRISGLKAGRHAHAALAQKKLVRAPPIPDSAASGSLHYCSSPHTRLADYRARPTRATRRMS
jgi:hypothetical protein